MPRRMLRPILALALGLVLGACPNPFGNDDEEEALEAARARWRRAAMTSYEYELILGCYCGGGGVPVVLTVREGAVAGVRPVDPTHPRPGESWFRPDDFHTVDELFEILERALREDAVAYRADYHPELGYPTSASIDFERNVIDEEMGWTARALVRVP